MNRHLAKLIAVAAITIWTSPLVAQGLPSWAGQPVLAATTSKGLTISMESEIAPLEINRIHSWLLRLNDAQGNLVSNAVIEFNGGMPEHNHGLPTQPQVTAEIQPGVYLLEGLRFHMQGAWRLELTLNWVDNGNSISDGVIIDFIL